MHDTFGRHVDRLRLSLTDRCNLSCRYCAPAEGNPDHVTIDAEFAVRVVKWLSSQHGIRYVRLTGGEPLLHRDVLSIAEEISNLDGINEVSLTTNGQLLERYAEALATAGLTRVNISLDTLKPDRFTELTRGGRVDNTIRGIEAAIDAQLTPVKINIVVQKGLNDDEIVEMAEWGLQRGCIVRFLEVMPIGPLKHVAKHHLITADQILDTLSSRFDLRRLPTNDGQPSTDYSARSSSLTGVIGVIPPTTKPFCARCRRIRLKADGSLVACLHHNKHFPLAPFWDGSVFDTASADQVLEEAVADKPIQGPMDQSVTMLSLGG